ncbi:unnamed protein product [Ambrosiozyma monospora]|uniref:Unnamed protein product n=1 Tax=Ambrosiozyma monospora TaxID=43982 RepID=A0ACB5SYP0_AMBMO|nr:unnamed protein product [Ambrosiozyma monospora]
MDHSQFAGGGVNGSLQRPNEYGTPQQQQQQLQAPPFQKEYTLPGIMQYLQSQFTLIEKNRMINDLEKSSLKLKVIELENQRNNLKLENTKLTNKVAELEKKLESLEASQEKDTEKVKDKEQKGKRNSSDGNSLLKSLKRSGSKKSRDSTESKANGTGTSTPNAVSKKEIDPLEDVNTVNIEKLLHARQFLKTATDEIMTLLKSPSLELSDPLNLNSREFFTNVPPSAGSGKSEGQQEQEYMNVDISLAPPFERSKKAKDPNNPHSNGDVSDAETITESDVEEPKEYQKQQKKKLMTIMKRSSGKDAATANKVISINAEFAPNMCTLISKMLICYSFEKGIVKVWDNLETERTLKLTITLPNDIMTVADIQASSDFVFVAGDRSLLIYPIGEGHDLELSSPAINYGDVDSDIKNIDVVNDFVLINSGTSVDILQINTKKDKLIPHYSVSSNDGEILSAKFSGIPNKLSKIAILTTKSLSFEDPKIKHVPKSKDCGDSRITLSPFTDYLLTGRNLVMNLQHGLFAIDFTDFNSFKRIPVKDSQSQDLFLGSAADDGSLLFVKNLKHTIDVFKMIETGDILNLKSFSGISSVGEWCCIGNTGTKYMICVGTPTGVTFYSL